MTRKQIIVLISSLAALIILVGAYFLLKNSKFFADIEAGPCGNDNPYYLETGKQTVPADFLLSINPADSLKWLGYKPTVQNFVCYNNTRVKSYVDSSGRIWFRSGTELPAHTKNVFYISKSASTTYVGDLFADTEIVNFPLKNNIIEKVPNSADSLTSWELTKNNNVSVTTSFPDVSSPAGNDAVKFSLSGNTAEASNKSGAPDVLLKSPWVSFDKDHTNVLSGWLKAENITMPDLDSNLDTPNTNKRINVYYEIYHKFPTAIGNFSEATVNSSIYEINTPTNADWDFTSTNTYTADFSSSVKNKLTNNQLINCDINKLRVVVQLTDFNGDVTLSNFSQFVNQGYKLALRNEDVSTEQPEWAPDFWAHYGTYTIEPHERTNFPGVSYSATADTKLYLTNNFSDYYKDHYDGDKLIVIDPVVQKIPGTDQVSVKEIKDFNSSGNSIIVGDLTNVEFKNFVDKYYPTLLQNKTLKDQGYALSVKGSEIIIVGKDMVGSYYGALRVADLLNSTKISNRQEFDYPDIGFRAWQYDHKAILSDIMPTVKADIVLASRLRFNGYLVSSVSDYSYLDTEAETLAAYQEAFAYARKYFIEPIPQVFSYAYAEKNILPANPARPALNPGDINRIYCQEKVVFWDDKTHTIHPINFGRLVQRKYSDAGASVNATIPLTVVAKDANGNITKTYALGTDYTIDVLDAAGTAIPSNEDDLAYQVDASGKVIRDDYNAPYRISRVPAASGGTIGEADTVYVTYNGYPLTQANTDATTYDGKDLPHSSIVRNSIWLPSLSYKDYAEKAIANAVKYLNPQYIHINNDEMNSVGMDYRDIFNPDGSVKARKSSAQMYADQTNMLNSYLKTKSSSTKLIIWDDMLNPYHRNGWRVYGNNYPTTLTAINAISKDLIIGSWNYASSNAACGMIKQSINKFDAEGFKVIGATSMSALEPESVWHCWVDALKNSASNSANNIGIIGTDNYRTRQDSVSALFLASIVWNNTPTSVTDIKDTTPPVISDVSIADGSTINLNPMPLSAKVTDDWGVDRVELWINNAMVSTVTMPDVNSVYSFSIKSSDYKGQEIEIKLVAYDLSNNQATDIRKTKVASDLIESATCSDGIKNQNETGVDCGGSCNACSITPQPITCSDGIQSGDETGVDCGGSCNVCPSTPLNILPRTGE
ncbi:MAG: hypothetical protein NTY30_00305 [Candidatus Berkelbacteria bacterium]|nr:hypothetical protein [Candidatus Berkelbacteria bacterium]